MNPSSERAVSDVVSFTLVFSTIIFMIGVVTVTGVGTLGDVQEGTESNVAEETMRNYASTLADHRTESATRRSTTIKLQGHNIEREGSHSIQWEVPGETPNTIVTGALVRTTDTEAELVYENGALFRVRNGNGVTVRRPPMRCGDRTAHLAVTKVRGDFSFSSDNRVTLQSELVNQRITTRDASSLTLTVSGTRQPGLWADALRGDWTGSGPYTCSGIDRVVVHETTVRISVVN